MHPINQLSATLFADCPKGLLYHYTTLSGMMGIVTSGSLWASEVRYMNDSAELRHTADLIRQEVQERVASHKARADLLGRFVDWVSHRITNGHLLFACSFRSNGNLLSQWRGYSTHGKGVSLGFDAEFIVECARRQGFQVGKCIYEPGKQRKLIGQVIDTVEEQAARQLSGDEPRERLPELYQPIFESIEVELLRIAAILKHPSFQEEREWRVVSPVYPDFAVNEPARIRFREANAMLVPYVEFGLQQSPQRRLALEHVFLGPTSNINISMNSLRMFLMQNRSEPPRGIDYCQIPYRQK